MAGLRQRRRRAREQRIAEKQRLRTRKKQLTLKRLQTPVQEPTPKTPSIPRPVQKWVPTAQDVARSDDDALDAAFYSLLRGVGLVRGGDA